MFAYCGNNPVCREDDSGYVWGTALLTIAVSSAFSVITSAASSVINGEKFTAGDAIGAAVEGAAVAAMTIVGIPVAVANPVATFCGGVLGKFIDNDTSAEASWEILRDTGRSFLWSGTFKLVGKIIPKFVNGNYVKLGPVGELLREAVYQPKYLDNNAQSTIFSENFWSSTQALFTEMIA